MFIRFVGLDVHKDSIKIAVAEVGRDKARFLSSIPNDSNKLLKKLHKIGSKDSIQCCYEAGPGGYTLHRALSSAGVDCRVIAPSLVPKQSGRRIKTDRLDAENLAHYLRSGDLVEVWGAGSEDREYAEPCSSSGGCPYIPSEILSTSQSVPSS